MSHDPTRTLTCIFGAASLLLSLSALAPVPAAAFSVERVFNIPNFLLGSPESNHETITHNALVSMEWVVGQEKHTFAQEPIERIKLVNMITDSVDMSDKRVHFDDENLLAGDALLYGLRMAIGKSAREGKAQLAWSQLGRALHTVQDFYAHTTWVEKQWVAQGLTAGPLAPLGQKFPFTPSIGMTCTSSVITTLDGRPTAIVLDGQLTGSFFELVQLTGNMFCSYANGKCIHGICSVANADLLWGGSGINKDQSSRDFFPQARDAGIRATQEYVRMILNDLQGEPAAQLTLLGRNSMLGDTLTFGRRWPTPTTPFDAWTPPTHTRTVVQGTADNINWLAKGQIYAVVSPEAESIAWTLPTASEYGGTSTVFDGFVVTGFRREIGSVVVESAAGIGVVASASNRTLYINLSGNYAANSSFKVRVSFK